MLKIIMWFTMPKSSMNIFYKDKKGCFKNKTFLKDTNNPFYMNGDLVHSDDVNYEDKIFKSTDKKTFE